VFAGVRSEASAFIDVNIFKKDLVKKRFNEGGERCGSEKIPKDSSMVHGHIVTKKYLPNPYPPPDRRTSLLTFSQSFGKEENQAFKGRRAQHTPGRRSCFCFHPFFLPEGLPPKNLTLANKNQKCLRYLLIAMR